MSKKWKYSLYTLGLVAPVVATVSTVSCGSFLNYQIMTDDETFNANYSVQTLHASLKYPDGNDKWNVPELTTNELRSLLFTPTTDAELTIKKTAIDKLVSLSVLNSSSSFSSITDAYKNLEFSYTQYKDSSNNDEVQHQVIISGWKISDQRINVYASTIRFTLTEEEITYQSDQSISEATIYTGTTNSYYNYYGRNFSLSEFNTLLSTETDDTTLEAKLTIYNKLFLTTKVLSPSESINVLANQPRSGSEFTMTKDLIKDMKFYFSLYSKASLTTDESYFVNLEYTGSEKIKFNVPSGVTMNLSS